jgi:hypothetical protein
LHKRASFNSFIWGASCQCSGLNFERKKLNPVRCHQCVNCSCWAVWSAWLADYVQEDIWHESWPIHMYFFTVITTASNVSVTRVLKDARSCEKKKPKGLCPGGNLGSVLLPLSLVCHEQSLLIPKTRF